MVSDEIRQTILIAVASMLLAGFLGFASYLMTLRSDFAATRNAEIQTMVSMSSLREFSKFNSKTLYGEDVVSAITMYYDSGVEVRVIDSSLNLTSGYETRTGIYSVNKYNMRSLPANVRKNKIDPTNLFSWFPVNKKYKAILIYGQVDLDTVDRDWDVRNPSASVNNNVSAIVFFYEGVRGS